MGMKSLSLPFRDKSFCTIWVVSVCASVCISVSACCYEGECALWGGSACFGSAHCHLAMPTAGKQPLEACPLPSWGRKVMWSISPSAHVECWCLEGSDPPTIHTCCCIRLLHEWRRTAGNQDKSLDVLQWVWIDAKGILSLCYCWASCLMLHALCKIPRYLSSVIPVATDMIVY